MPAGNKEQVRHLVSISKIGEWVMSVYFNIRFLLFFVNVECTDVTLPKAYALNYHFGPQIIKPYVLEEFFRPKHGLSFDKKAWAAAPFGSYQKYAMGNELDRRKVLIGKNSDEVLHLLGEPDFRDKTGLGKPSFLYRLAPQESFPAKSFFYPKFFNFDVWTLMVVFESNKVSESRILAP